MVGAEVYDEFTAQNRDDYIELMRHFEIKKRWSSEETEKDVIFLLPLSLLDLYQRRTGVELGKNDIKEGITVKRNKLHIKKTEFKQLFTETCRHIVEHLRKIIGRDEVGNISVIMMVGGFSESLVLQDAVKQSFPEIKVIVPRDASLCVLKGAVMYGHFSNVITERVIRYTYGTNVYKPFEENIHPISKLIETETGIFCKDIFSKYVQAGQVVKVGEPQTQKLYRPAKDSQKKMFLAIYASELPDPEFVTDPGCTRIGTITVDMPNSKEDLEREVLVTFSFSGTELIVTAKDTTSGTVSNVILDLLS